MSERLRPIAAPKVIDEARAEFEVYLHNEGCHRHADMRHRAHASAPERASRSRLAVVVRIRLLPEFN